MLSRIVERRYDCDVGARELFVVNTTEDEEFTNEKELIEAYVFARKFAEASNLLAATMFAVGSSLELLC